MGFNLNDRVKEVVTVSGVGPITLPGVQLLGYRTFAATLTAGDTTWYAIEDPTSGGWEVGLGTWDGITLTRTTVYSSSNGGSAVNFPGNSCNVFQDLPASQISTGGSVVLAANSVLANPGTASAAGQSVTIGDPLSGGVFVNAINELVGTAPTTYYLTLAPDATGIAGYYTAARVQDAAHSGSLGPFSLPGTTLTTLVSFITPPDDPGAISFAPGNMRHLIYASLGSAGSATVVVQMQARHLDGTETLLGTSAATTLTATSAAAVAINWRKQSAQALISTDRLVFRVRATRVSGADPLTITLAVNSVSTQPTVTTTITGTGVPSPGYEFNVMSFGAVGDMLTLADGLMSNGSTTLSSITAVSLIGGFQPWMQGKTIEVSGALATGFPLLTTIASVTNTSTIELAAPATQATGISFLANAICPPPSGVVTGNYLAGVDLMTLQGGTFTTAAVVQAATTNMRELSAAVVNAGSLGTPGAVTLIGTTGVGDPFRLNAVVTAGGTLDPSSLSDLFVGVYTTNPTNPSAEPVTAIVTATGDANPLAGVTVSVGMDLRTVVPTITGSYTVVPSDPTSLSAGSVSGATGAELSATWNTTGRTVFGTDDSAAFSAALSRAVAVQALGNSVAVVGPARNFMIQSGSWPVMTEPVAFIGAEWGQTKIYWGEGYTGPHGFGFSELFTGNGVQPGVGPNTMMSQQTRNAGVYNVSLYSNRSKTVPMHAIVFYDRCQGVNVDFVEFDNFNGAAILTGEFYFKTVAYLGESYIGTVRSRSCGNATYADFHWSARGNAARTNNLVMQSVQSVFPLGIGMIFKSYAANLADASKGIYVDYFRCEREGNNPGGGVGNLLQFGSPDSTDDIADITMNRVVLVSPQIGGAAVGFAGASSRIRPHDIQINSLLVYGGGSYGNGIDVQAGKNLSIGISRMAVRGTDIIIASTTPNPRNNIVGAGSTTANLVLDAGASATTNAYTGGAVLLTSVATGTGVIVSGVLTVSGAVTTAGQFRVGSRIVMNGLPFGITIGSLGTGSGGNGSYNLVNAGVPYTGSLGSRAVTATISNTRQAGAYNGATKTLTIGSNQGSSATWDWAPQAGEAYSIFSLVVAPVSIDANDAEAGFVYSIGANSSSILKSPIHPVGTPGTTQTINQDYNWTGADTFSNAIITGGTVDGLVLNALTAGRGIYASGTGTLAQFAWPPNWSIVAGTLVPSATVMVGLSNDIASTLPLGTYDLGPFIQGGTILNSYAHVASGTFTYTVATGQPGTYTAVTGLSAISSTSTTIDTVGTATAANVIAAGAHAWVIVSAAAPGGDAFITVKVP